MAISECRERAVDSARYVGDCLAALDIAKEVIACDSKEKVAQRFGKHDDWDIIRQIAELVDASPPDHVRLK